MGRAPFGKEAMTSAERVRRHRERLRAAAPPRRPADQAAAQAEAALATAQQQIGVLLLEIGQLRHQIAALKARPASAPTGKSGTAFTRAQLAALLFALHPDHARHADIAEKRRQALQLVAERMKPRRK